jgi:membrane protein
VGEAGPGLWVRVAGLRVYVVHFGDYNATYGSIGGVILLLLWLYLTGVVLLVGAEISHAHQAVKAPALGTTPTRRRAAP